MRTVKKMCRKFIKLAGALMTVILAAAMAALVIFGIKGYVMYKNAAAQVPVSLMYTRISSEEGFVSLEALPNITYQQS